MQHESDFLCGAAFGDLVGGGGVFSLRGPAEAYRAGDLLTATPRRLAGLLYQSATRLCAQAIEALDEGDLELAGDRLARARGILRQLQNAVAPAVGAAARRLWEFCEDVHQRLIEADYYRRREAVVETLAMLASRRPDWLELARGARKPAASAGPGECRPDWIG